MTRSLTVYTFLLCLIHLNGHTQNTFTNIAPGAGIQFQHHSDYTTMGGGVAIFDYNNDTLLDIFYTGGQQASVLYQNLGGNNFVDVSLSAGIGLSAGVHVTGVQTGDINNDGFRDLFLYTSTGSHNYLLLNNGDGTFSDITSSAGLDRDSLWTFGASFGDINRDGFLDLYVGYFIETALSFVDSMGNMVGFGHTCNPNSLFLNNGDNTFTEISNNMLVADIGCNLASRFTDYDNDGDLDLFVVNDFGEWVAPNSIYQNNYPSSFLNVGASSGADAQVYGMGIAVGDYDQDMDLDYYITNIGRNVLERNMGNGLFIDSSDAAGIGNRWVFNDSLQATGWGCALVDIDNDSYLDLYVANGYIVAFPELMTSELDPDKLYHNNGDGTFSDISNQLPLDSSAISRGFAYGDMDNDGDIDLLPVSIYTNTSLPIIYHPYFKNELNNSNHWAKIHLNGTVSNADAYGAKIFMHIGNQSWVHEVSGQGSHCSQSSSVAHFGLGMYNVIDSFSIHWPSGHIDQYYNQPVDQNYFISEGSTGGIQVEILSKLNNQSCNNFTGNLYTNGQFSSYIWSTGDTSHQIEVIQSGTYYLTTTDPNGYISFDSFFVNLVVSDSLVVLQNNVSCYGGNNGTASASYFANTGIIDYQWSNGQTDSVAQNLLPGTYGLTITDVYGCPDSIYFLISAPPEINITHSIINNSCYGDSLGSIDLQITGGTPPYQFNWSNNQTTQDISDLYTGNYSVFIMDSNNCTKNQSFFISAPSIPIQINFTAYDTICINSTQGSFDLNLQGGTPPYDYLWSSGDTTEDISGLGVGIYSLTISDAFGCIANFIDSIQYAAPIEYDILIDQDSTDGTADVYIQNLGDSTLNYLWFDASTDSMITDLMAGIYTLTITDPYGCVSDTTIQIPLITVIHEKKYPTIQLYPVPAKSFLYLNCMDITTPLEIEILSTSGQLMMKTIIHKGLNRLNIDKLSAGVYQIHFSIRNEPRILQFIKD